MDVTSLTKLRALFAYLLDDVDRIGLQIELGWRLRMGRVDITRSCPDFLGAGEGI